MSKIYIWHFIWQKKARFHLDSVLHPIEWQYFQKVWMVYQIVQQENDGIKIDKRRIIESNISEFVHKALFKTEWEDLEWGFLQNIKSWSFPSLFFGIQTKCNYQTWSKKTGRFSWNRSLNFKEKTIDEISSWSRDFTKKIWAASLAGVQEGKHWLQKTIWC